MRRLLPLLLLAGCVTAPPPAPPGIRIVHECSWVKTLKHTFAASDTPETKREMIAITDAISKNCPSK